MTTDTLQKDTGEGFWQPVIWLPNLLAYCTVKISKYTAVEIVAQNVKQSALAIY